MKIYGKRSVSERLKTAPLSIKKVFLQEGANLSQILEELKNTKRPYVYLERYRFDKITRNLNTQGVFAEVGDYKFSALEDVFSSPDEKRPTLLFLDGITDPQNIGSIIRTTACFGGFVLVLPRYESCQITEAVLRVASGGENYLPIASVANLSKAIRAAKDAGYHIVATVTKGGEDLFKAKLPFPLALVIGSEEKGIKSGIIKDLERKLTLPMSLANLSFNVAVATALFCYEVTRQRNGL